MAADRKQETHSCQENQVSQSQYLLLYKPGAVPRGSADRDLCRKLCGYKGEEKHEML